MNNSVLLSIRPEWCAKIANGRKTVEIRKTKPKLPIPFKCYIYRTNNGGIIGEFVCDSIVEIPYWDECRGCEDYGEHYISEKILIESCLTRQELEEYGGEKMLFGWHISDLRMYEESKSIAKRPPQSWCYTE